MKYGIRQKSLLMNDEQLFLTAKKLAFDGVELNTQQNYRLDRLWRRSEIERIHRLVKKTNIEIFSISLSAIRDYGFLDPSSHKRKIGQNLIKHLLYVGSQIGITVLMLPVFSITRDHIDSPQLIQELVEAAQSAKEKGIILALETFLSADDLLSLLQKVGSSNLGICVDVGITTSCGRDVEETLIKLRKSLAQIHIKDCIPLEMPNCAQIDFSTLQQMRSKLTQSGRKNEDGSTNWATNLGEGNVNFLAVQKALSSIDYDGYLILETPPGPNPLANATRNLTFLRNLMRQSH